MGIEMSLRDAAAVQRHSAGAIMVVFGTRCRFVNIVRSLVGGLGVSQQRRVGGFGPVKKQKVTEIVVVFERYFQNTAQL
jgi:hypothetical protein